MTSSDVREMLEEKLKAAAKGLRDASGSSAFALPLEVDDGRQIYVAVGTSEHILGLLIPGDENDIEGDDGGVGEGDNIPH